MAASAWRFTRAARRAVRNPSSSSGKRSYRRRLTTRPMTASPRNSSRSLWPSTRVGFSLKYELWTNACAMASRSRRTMPSRSLSSSTDGIAMGPSLLLVLLDVFDGVGDLLDLLGIFVRDLHAELLFEAHDQLDEVQRVRVEVLD